MNSTPHNVSWSPLPAEAKHLFLLAAEHWEDNARSECYVEQALRQFADELEVLVSAYRYYFYKSRPERALALSDQVLRKVRQLATLPSEWDDLQPALVAGKDDPTIRIYLAAYAAQGLLLAQLGRLDEARRITGRVKELDDRREFCATTVYDVLSAVREAEFEIAVEPR